MKAVTIVGAGALGSHLALLARNWDVELRVIDFDKVESKNTQSQFHSKMGLGKNKAKALQQALHGLFGVHIKALTTKVNQHNCGVLLSGADLIVDCTDNYKARDIIQEFVEEHDIPCLHGCLSADGDLARMVWTENFAPDKENPEGDATCEDGRNVAFHAMAGAMLAQVARKFLEEDVKQSWQVTPFTMLRLT